MFKIFINIMPLASFMNKDYHKKIDLKYCDQTVQMAQRAFLEAQAIGQTEPKILAKLVQNTEERLARISALYQRPSDEYGHYAVVLDCVIEKEELPVRESTLLKTIEMTQRFLNGVSEKYEKTYSEAGIELKLKEEYKAINP
jgi:hypothetical protein